MTCLLQLHTYKNKLYMFISFGVAGYSLCNAQHGGKIVVDDIMWEFELRAWSVVIHVCIYSNTNDQYH